MLLLIIQVIKIPDSNVQFLKELQDEQLLEAKYLGNVTTASAVLPVVHESYDLRLR